jgi:hypothetical protein
VAESSGPRPRAVRHGSQLAPGAQPVGRGKSDGQPRIVDGAHVIVLDFDGYEALQDFHGCPRALQVFSQFYEGLLKALGGGDDLKAAALVWAGSRYLTIQNLLDQRDPASMINGMNGYRSTRGG